MQYPKNNARRSPDYRDHIHTAAQSERCRNAYRCAGVPTPLRENFPTEPCDTDRQGQMNESLAMAYVPFQEFRDLYEADNALCAGTLFRELEKPFTGQRRRVS